MDFVSAYALTLAVETAVLLLLLRGKHAARVIMRNSIAANTLTLPFVWFFFPLLGLTYGAQIAASEFFAFATEAGVYAALFAGMTGREALAASFLANAASFLLGLALTGIA